MTPRLDACAAVMGVSGPVGKIAAGGTAASVGVAGIADLAAPGEAMAGVEGSDTVGAAGAPVADWAGADATGAEGAERVAVGEGVAGVPEGVPEGVAQPDSHSVMATR